MRPWRSMFAARKLVPPRSTAQTRSTFVSSGSETLAISHSRWERVGERDLGEDELVDAFSLRTKPLSLTLSQRERGKVFISPTLFFSRTYRNQPQPPARHL